MCHEHQATTRKLLCLSNVGGCCCGGRGGGVVVVVVAGCVSISLLGARATLLLLSS